MTAEHITRDYSAHRKSIKRPYGEYVKFEVFAYEPKSTKRYLRETNSLSNGVNTEKCTWKSWSCYRSKNKIDDMEFTLKYTADESAQYQIDLIYEQSNHIWKDNNKDDAKYDTGKNLIGELQVVNNNKVVYSKNVSYTGENNVLKRVTSYVRLSPKTYKILVNVPHNCYFMGCVVRKIKYYCGDTLDSGDTNLLLESASFTKSEKCKASEVSVDIAYSETLECLDSQSGFYIDYRNECNLYVKDDNGTIRRVFGGYVSSILPDSDRTKLTIHCADRLVDGSNKYVLDEMVLGGGTVSQKEDEYSDGMTKNFSSYPEALKYLCNIHEVSLKSNISKDYTVDGEKYHKGLTISFGKKKSVKKISVTNGYSTPYDNYILLRNNSEGDKKQVWTLYDASKVAKTPPDITSKGFMHITYGLGGVKKSKDSTLSEKVDVSDTTAGVQSWTKCGVSADKKYVMFIGQPSNKAMSKKYGYRSIMKRVYKNKCPYCGKAELRWDDSHGNGCITGNGHKGNKSSVTEGEITCNHCDMDFEGVSGKEKINGSKRKLTPVTNPVKSSEAERKKLSSGKMKAVPKSCVELTPDSIFQAITNLAFKYKYKRGTSSSWSSMKKTGHGDCWAFSELIFTELKRYGVSCKIVEYVTNASDQHRSVLYVNSDGKWEDFPYKKYGWGSKYNNMLNNTSKSKSAKGYVKKYKGSRINKVKGSASTTKSQTTKVTTTSGYDKDKPFQAYLKLTYSLQPSFSAKKYAVYVKFTLNATAKESINTGLPLYWINNKIKKTTLKLDNNRNLIDFIHNLRGESKNIYLQSIHFITPVKKVTDSDKENYWYKNDNQTVDNSSCKLNLYQIVFDDNPSANPEELHSCGKTVNSMLSELVDSTGYLVDMNYQLHRKDDIISFRVANQTSESFTATEGDNNNILSWGNISYSPVQSLRNMSMCVYKASDGLYYYVDTRSPSSILDYGEQCTLMTSNNEITSKEAYFNARMSGDWNPLQDYSYTITVPNLPNVRLGDLVRVVANNKCLNDLKEIKSIKISYSINSMPRVRTELGLGELAPDIQLKKNIRRLRESARKDTTSFSKSAIVVNDRDVYEWDV